MSARHRASRVAWAIVRGLVLWVLVALIFWAAFALLPGIDVPSFGAVLLTTGLVALLIVAYLSAAFGPVPPSVAAVAWAGILGGLMTGALGYWIDRHRTVKA